MKQIDDVEADTALKQKELDDAKSFAENLEKQKTALKDQIIHNQSEADKAGLRTSLAKEELEKLRVVLAEAQAASQERAEEEEARAREEEALQALQRQMDKELVGLQSELATQEDLLQAAQKRAEEANAEVARLEEKVRRREESAAGLGLGEQHESVGSSPSDPNTPITATQQPLVGRLRRSGSSFLNSGGASGSFDGPLANNNTKKSKRGGGQGMLPASPTPAEGSEHSTSNEAAPPSEEELEIRERLANLDSQQHEHEVAIAQLQRKKAQLDADITAAKAAKKDAKKDAKKSLKEKTKRAFASEAFDDDDGDLGSTLVMDSSSGFGGGGSGAVVVEQLFIIWHAT